MLFCLTVNTSDEAPRGFSVGVSSGRSCKEACDLAPVSQEAVAWLRKDCTKETLDWNSLLGKLLQKNSQSCLISELVGRVFPFKDPSLSALCLSQNLSGTLWSCAVQATTLRTRPGARCQELVGFSFYVFDFPGGGSHYCMSIMRIS